MLSRVLPIRRLLYGSPAPVHGGGAEPPARIAASAAPAPSAGAVPCRSAQARAVPSAPPGAGTVQALAKH
ncbi:hypothetical protein C8E08_2241 [Paracidovorax citrulli]|nr:hypothetical protein C8E08_2241 [Paracidovorax citrulli]QCX10794.1 hypothetical protein APS58_1950 [Paracidovorax citrulli]REG70913.1 hypothetical protein C8E07_4132 [Paracidovorax citrulli]RLJ95465.1 hypothetical protein C8E06_4127 [Paracidovorax citrulli]SDL36831.1 hypothetical protein SAMN04489709_14120 [Paracidovorax citrulli]